MSVTEYLERARECADLADRMKGDDKKRLLEIADAWAKMAMVEAAKAAATQNGEVVILPLPNPPKPSPRR